jgi:hypothetical protein
MIDVGDRIEIPVHYDMWAMGARYGVVTSKRGDKPGRSAYISVKLDALPVKARRLKVWALDFDYCRTIAPRLTVA